MASKIPMYPGDGLPAVDVAGHPFVAIGSTAPVPVPANNDEPYQPGDRQLRQRDPIAAPRGLAIGLVCGIAMWAALFALAVVAF